MSRGPVIPGYRVYPGTSQHWTYGQVIDNHDLLRAAVIISGGLLGMILFVQILAAVWH